VAIENAAKNAGIAPVGFDAEKFLQEYQSRLDRMAKLLGEEFEATHHVRLTDALDALGEEFDKVREPLELRIDELQKDQETLHGGLVSYVEEARQNHARLAALEQKLEDVMQRQTAHVSDLASAAQSQHLAHLSHIAEYLGEEFDRAHTEKAQPIESCLRDLRNNQESLAIAVQALQQQFALPGGYGLSLEELKKQQAKLSKVVQDMIEDPKLLVQVNSSTTSPKRLQQSPGINSQESTSDSKRELHGKRSPDGTSDALSEVGSQLDNGGEWDRLHDKVVSLPVELEALRSENGASAEAEMSIGQERLLAITEDVKPQNFDRLSKIVATLQERQSSLASELEILRQRYPQPLEQSVAPASMQKHDELHKVSSLALPQETNGVRGELDKLLGARDVTDMIVKMAGLPKELQAMKQEHHARLREMAESLGEEFHHAAAALENFSLGVSSDMACALGEEFDKVYDENNQLLQSKIEAMRETQAKLVEIVLRQECYSSLAENANAAEMKDSEKSSAQTQFESLCCFVRSEIAMKVDALRQELVEANSTSAMHQELALSCKAAQESNDAQLMRLYQATREHAALLEDLRRRHLVATEVSRSAPIGHLDAPNNFSENTEDTSVVGERSTALAASADVQCEQVATFSHIQSPVEAQAPECSASAETREELSIANDPISTLQDAHLAGQESVVELGGDNDHTYHRSDSSDRGFFTLGVDQFESVTQDLASDAQSADWRQREALRKVMDDELRRARMALESMPNFGGLAFGRDQNGVDTIRIHSQALDVPEILEFGDPEETPLRERWPVLYVLPGLRAGMSEDAPAGQSKQPLTASVPEKVVSRPSVAAVSTTPSASVTAVPAPSSAATDVLAAPSDVGPNPLPKTAVEQVDPERPISTIPEVAQT